MAEPVPSASSPAGDHPSLPTNAEDRAAAAALSSLNTAQIDDAEEGGSAPAAGAGKRGRPSKADQEALGKAMSRLEMIAGTGSGTGTGEKEAGKKKEGGVEEKGEMKEAVEEVRKKPVVKITADNVNMLVGLTDRLVVGRRWMVVADVCLADQPP